MGILVGTNTFEIYMAVSTETKYAPSLSSKNSTPMCMYTQQKMCADVHQKTYIHEQIDI